MKPQTKSFSAFRFGMKATAEGQISGYGSIFGNVDSYGEVVERGAFTDTLQRHKEAGTAPLMLWQHDAQKPIGRWDHMAEDSVGLFMSGQINTGTSWGRDAWAAVSAGDIDGLSIGYVETKTRPDGALLRLEAVDLREVSVVSMPANRKARIRLTGKSDLEDLLTDSGLSNAAAKKIVAGGWSALVGDDDPEAVDALDTLHSFLKSSSLNIRARLK